MVEETIKYKSLNDKLFNSKLDAEIENYDNGVRLDLCPNLNTIVKRAAFLLKNYSDEAYIESIIWTERCNYNAGMRHIVKSIEIAKKIK